MKLREILSTNQRLTDLSTFSNFLGEKMLLLPTADNWKNVENV